MPKPAIISLSGDKLESTPKVPKCKAIRPWGGKIMIEDLRPEEMLHTQLHMPDSTKIVDAPQAYIVEFGPKIPKDCGLEVGQRIIWQGTGIPVKDPRQTRRVRALVDIHQIVAVVDEESALAD